MKQHEFPTPLPKTTINPAVLVSQTQSSNVTCTQTAIGIVLGLPAKVVAEFMPLVMGKRRGYTLIEGSLAVRSLCFKGLSKRILLYSPVIEHFAPIWKAVKITKNPIVLGLVLKSDTEVRHAVAFDPAVEVLAQQVVDPATGLFTSLQAIEEKWDIVEILF